MTIDDLYRSMEWGSAPESAALAEAWLDARGRRLLPFVNGTFQEPVDGVVFETHNPATGAVLGHVAQCSAADVDAAVAGARAAQPGWLALGGHGRARHLYAIARHIQKQARLLAVLETLDNGKPVRESRDIDVPLLARHFYHHAGWAQLMETELPNAEPLGVVGQVIPWNFPLLMLAWKIAPALAMGNTVVLKPAELTSITAVAFAELCAAAGLPAGVVNIITGDGRTGGALVKHPDVDKIAFTGSTAVGRSIREATAGSGKKLSLELGGKSPFVVFEDADLDGAIEGVVDAIWFNQGEVCCAGSRLLVQEGVAERFHDGLRRRMETLRVGDPLDKGTDIGAIVSQEQRAAIEALVQRGVEDGAQLWQPQAAVPTEGCFLPPTLLTGVEPAATVAQEEIFGPVLVSMTFRTPAEAVALANNTRFGLAASIWTQDLDRALDVAARVKAGTVWINCTNQFDAAAGFGGYRESGFGREGGREGLREYVRPTWHAMRGASAEASATPTPAAAAPALPTIDRTAKLYIGGSQARPDGGYQRPVFGPGGERIGEVGDGNRKDIRNAVAAARKAQPAWGAASAHLRAQVLYYVAENLGARAADFAALLSRMTGASADAATAEVDASLDRLFHWAAWADKHDGRVHATGARQFTFAVHEPIGTLGIVCPPKAPLLALLSTTAAAVAMGNAVIAVPSADHPFAATELYQVLDTSDVPGGILNLVTGDPGVLGETLASHDDVDALWHFGSAEHAATAERLSAGNLKRTWSDHGHPRDWADPTQGADPAFLDEAVQVKNIWTPYGA